MIGRTYTTEKGHIYSVEKERAGREVIYGEDGNFYVIIGFLDRSKIDFVLGVDGSISWFDKSTERPLDGELESRLEREPKEKLGIVCLRSDKNGKILSSRQVGNGSFVTSEIVNMGQKIESQES